MKHWAWALFLVVLWLALTNSASVPNILLGLAVAYSILFITRQGSREATVKVNPLQIPIFIGFMLQEMIVANLRVIHDVLTPKHYSEPGIISFTPNCSKGYQRVWLANMISLTPGTLTLDTDLHADKLYIHVMFLDDRAAVVAELRKIEHQLLRMLP